MNDISDFVAAFKHFAQKDKERQFANSQAVLTNPARKILPENGKADFNLLEDKRLGLQDAPEGTEEAGNSLPLGTLFVTLGNGNNGNRPPCYAFTVDGRVFDDSWRMMTHGGCSPWKLCYVTKWFKNVLT